MIIAKWRLIELIIASSDLLESEIKSLPFQNNVFKCTVN